MPPRRSLRRRESDEAYWYTTYDYYDAIAFEPISLCIAFYMFWVYCLCTAMYRVWWSPPPGPNIMISRAAFLYILQLRTVEPLFWLCADLNGRLRSSRSPDLLSYSNCILLFQAFVGLFIFYQTMADVLKIWFALAPYSLKAVLLVLTGGTALYCLTL